MKQKTAIHLLLGVVLVTTLCLLYLLVAPPGKAMLSPTGWMWFGVAALTLILAVTGPILFRRRMGLPEPVPLSPADIRFFIVLLAVVCPLCFWAVWFGGGYGSMVIMVVPIACMFRFRRPLDSKSGDNNV